MFEERRFLLLVIRIKHIRSLSLCACIFARARKHVLASAVLMCARVCAVLFADEHDEALEMLRKAEILSGPDDLVTAVTYNNLACYFRRYVTVKNRNSLQVD